MNLLLLFEEDALGGDCWRIAGRRFQHLVDVLKVVPGDRLTVGLLNGPIGEGEVIEIDAVSAIVRTAKMHLPMTPVSTVDLICALPRPKTLRRVLFAAGMFGLGSVHLVRANRTEKSYLQSPLLRETAYRPYLLEGLSQGEWTRLPVVRLYPLFRPFIEDTVPTLAGGAETVKLLADLSGTQSLAGALSRVAPKHMLLAIGPEGGWVDFEREKFREQGFTPFTLGRSNLRVDFAMAAALGQIELLSTISSPTDAADF